MIEKCEGSSSQGEGVPGRGRNLTEVRWVRRSREPSVTSAPRGRPAWHAHLTGLLVFWMPGFRGQRRLQKEFHSKGLKEEC